MHFSILLAHVSMITYPFYTADPCQTKNQLMIQISNSKHEEFAKQRTDKFPFLKKLEEQASCKGKSVSCTRPEGHQAINTFMHGLCGCPDHQPLHYQTHTHKKGGGAYIANPTRN
jgi:hypothetical protein